MNQGNRKILKKVNLYQRVIVVFVIICIVMIVVCTQYYFKLNNTIYEESENYLQEVSRRIGSNIDRIIEDNFDVLYTMSAVVENNKTESIQDMRITLKKQQEYWNYESIMLIDEEGKAFNLDNQEVFLNIENTMRQDILDKKQTMSTTQLVNNNEFILFSIPLDDLAINGRKMIALAASYEPVAFEKVLSMTSFNKQAYSQIITKSGTVVTRASTKYAMKTGYNIFSSIENAQLEDTSLNEVKKDMMKNRAGQISFKLDDVHRYMVYTPIQPNDWYLLTFVPFQVVNEKSELLLKMTTIICSLITLVFAGLISALAYSFSNHKRKLMEMAYVDQVTKGNTIQRFYELSRDILDESKEKNYALIYTNIQKFKLLNEQFGEKNCDNILYHFNKFIQSFLTNGECMGRLSADNFCLLLEYKNEKELIKRFDKWHEEALKFKISDQLTYSIPMTEFGIYVIDDRNLTFPQMIDRAKLALKESSWSIDSRLRYAFYDDGVHRKLFREKQLEDRMVSALQEGEFQVYLQPKYHLDETIGGAEALVRWLSKEEGMIYPNEFIPLFEKNGFIVKLDLWVFEEVCRKIRSWVDQGLNPVKISVNCSRVHLNNANFLRAYIDIAEIYKIEKNQIEIELTESVVMEDTERLTKVIEDIKSAGFGCSMDDFGSGYSSLNLIQSIPVDTLKLDRIFFQMKGSDYQRTEAVVGSIIQMAKALSMETVAEGVEYPEQVEMLKKVGCDYIQGYIFAKPMKLSEFEELAFYKK